MLLLKSLFTFALYLSASHGSYLINFNSLAKGRTEICSYLGSDVTFFEFPLSQRLSPKIVLTLPPDNPLLKDFEVQVSISSGEDLLKVKENKSRITCLDDESFKHYCTPNIAGNKDLQIYSSLDDIISKKGNVSIIVQAELSYTADGLRTLEYNVDTAGVYCTSIQSFNKLENFDQESFSVLNLITIRYQQVFGLADSFDYNDLVLEFYSFIAQLIVISIFGFHTFKKISKDKLDASLSLNNSVYQKSSIQLKIMIFLAGSMLYYFFNYLYLRKLNIYGYEQFSENGLLFISNSMGYTQDLIKLLQPLFTIAITTWAIYNFLLLSSGVFFGFFINSKRMLIIKLVIIVLVIERLSDVIIVNLSRHQSVEALNWYFYHYDKLAWLAYVLDFLVFILGGYWAIEVRSKLSNKVLQRKLMATYVLLIFVFIFYFAFANTKVEYTLVDMLYEVNLSYFSASIASRIFTIFSCSLIAYIWREVKFVNNVIV